MIIEAIDHYLSHGSPSQADRDILEVLRKRRLAHRDFVASFDPKMNQGFLRIERVTSARPVLLFGQNVPSYAYNRVIVSRGVDGPDGKRIPGKSLVTALISEESLAQLMLSPNRSNNKIGLTAESFLGDFLPPREGKGRRSSSDLLGEAIDNSSERRKEAVRALQERVNALRGGIGKSAMSDIVSLLGQIAAQGDTSFLLERHTENLQRDLVQYRVEAASAALNISDLLADVDRIRLLGVSDPDFDITDLDRARNSNPILDAAMMQYRPSEAIACQKALKSYALSMIEDIFPEGLNYNVNVDDPHGKILRQAIPWGSSKHADTSRLEKAVTMASSLGNVHLNKSRGIADGYGLTASSSYISGGDTNLHASFPSTGNGHFCLRLHVGILSESFGNEDIEEGSTFIEVGMSTEDMMTALRGHPTGSDIPCSLDRILGNSVPRVTYESELTYAISDPGQDPEYLSVKRDLDKMIGEVKELVLGGAKTVKDRRRLQDLTSELQDEVERFSVADGNNIRNRAGRLNQEVSSMAREAIASIDDHVQKKHGVSLASLGADPRDGNLTIESDF
ncbi:hypothetical protein [Pseudosulfitobacter pseudonitzschiae]|uniref:hypothetical protein n=1 Tax=Pseudosulfitobacter pseudonitzschiae TaxID=1402135 RepID=UPI003B7B671A